ncbi:MAG TPA: hypothetical protein VN912_06440 [Candidatus Angelobacter sp.]|nr:hypothetical protein [Candidatus Angelobacter sp.]
MNSSIFSKSAKGLILASGLIAASSVLAYAQDTTVALGAQATVPLSSLYASAPAGSASLGGHTFDLSGGNLVSLGNGQSATYTGSWNNAQSVYLLLNTMNTYLWFDQTVVGNVTLTFSDGTTQSTDLMVGGNIREWRTGAGNTVNWTSDPATSYVWSGSATDGSSATIDMLTISVSPAKTITAVTVNDTNGWGALHIDLAGLTVDPTAPVASCNMPGNSCSSQAPQHSQAALHSHSANFTATPTAPGQLARIHGTSAKTNTKAH